MAFDQSVYEATGWKTALVEDLYERLGLDANCTPADIQASFHARRKWWEIQEQRLKGHTGHQSPLVQRVGPSIAEALKRLQEGRDVLSDPRQRANLDFERTKKLEEQWHQRIGALVEIAVADDRFLSQAERRQILLQVADIPRQRAEAIVDQQARAKGASVESEGRKEPSSAAGTGIPPRLAVEPNQFSFTGVKVGEQLRGSCVVNNVGGGVFSGRVSSNRPWLRLENEVLVPSLNRQEIRFSVDTRILPPGYSDTATMELATSGGTALVPIALSIELREALRARFYSRFMPGTVLLSGFFSILASYFAVLHLSPVGLLLLSLFLAWAGAKALCRNVLVYRLGGGTRAGTFGRAAGIAFGAFMLAAVAVGWMSSLSSEQATPQQTVQRAEPTVTVKNSVVNVRSGPGVSFITLAKAHPGQQLLAVGRRQDWLAVRWPAGSSQLGWVSRALVQGRDQDLAALPLMAQAVRLQGAGGSREELAEKKARTNSAPTERPHDSTELAGGTVSTPPDASATVIGGSYKVYPADDALAAAASAMTIDQSGSTFTVRGNGWTGHGTLSGRQGHYDWAYADGHSSGYCDFSVRSDGSLVGQVRGSRVNWSYVAQRTAGAPSKPPSEPPGAPPTEEHR